MEQDPTSWFCKLQEIDGQPKFPVSNEMKELLRAMLQYDPRKRITVKDALNHPYFQREKMVKNQ
jgi:serine/threonine protein kinase